MRPGHAELPQMSRLTLRLTKSSAQPGTYKTQSPLKPDAQLCGQIFVFEVFQLQSKWSRLRAMRPIHPAQLALLSAEIQTDDGTQHVGIEQRLC